MNPVSEADVREHIARYLAGQMSLDELRLWIMPLLWQLDANEEPWAYDIVTQLALYFAEYGAGHRTDEEMRGLIGQYGVQVTPEGHTSLSS